MCEPAVVAISRVHMLSLSATGTPKRGRCPSSLRLASSAAARLNFGRREGMRKIAQRMHDQGVLRDDVTVDEASDVLWLITSFETFGQLYRERRLTPPQVGERLMAMTRRTLYRPDS